MSILAPQYRPILLYNSLDENTDIFANNWTHLNLILLFIVKSTPVEIVIRAATTAINCDIGGRNVGVGIKLQQVYNESIPSVLFASNAKLSRLSKSGMVNQITQASNHSGSLIQHPTFLLLPVPYIVARG